MADAAIKTTTKPKIEELVGRVDYLAATMFLMGAFSESRGEVDDAILRGEREEIAPETINRCIGDFCKGTARRLFGVRRRMLSPVATIGDEHLNIAEELNAIWGTMGILADYDVELDHDALSEQFFCFCYDATKHLESLRYDWDKVEKFVVPAASI